MRILKIFFILFIFYFLFSCHPKNVILPEYSDQEVKDADLAIHHSNTPIFHQFINSTIQFFYSYITPTLHYSILHPYFRR
jgi:hypothetical protein